MLWLPTTASAILVVSIERVSDSTAILSATGSAFSDDDDLKFLGNVATTGGAGTTNDSVISNFEIGGVSLVSAYIIPGTTRLRLNFDADLIVGPAPTGMISITLTDEIWSGVGKFGDLQSGQGRWIIIASSGGSNDTEMPDPATLALFGLGLLGLGLARRRKKLAA